MLLHQLSGLFQLTHQKQNQCALKKINHHQSSFLPHLSLFFLSSATGVLILINLLAQSGDLVFQVFQLTLYLPHTLNPGLALHSCCLTDAGEVKKVIKFKGQTKSNE